MVLIEVGGPEGEIALPTGPAVDLRWLHRAGVATGRSDGVARTLRAAELPEGQVYAWVAGESGMVKEVRRHLVRERGVDKRRVEFCGYWLHKAHDDKRFLDEMEEMYAEMDEVSAG